jgi:hypothetical protein
MMAEEIQPQDDDRGELYDHVQRGRERLAEIADRIKAGEKQVISSPRELLAFFERSRRTWLQVKTIEGALDDLGLETKPYFDGVGLNDQIVIRPKNTQATTPAVGIDRRIFINHLDRVRGIRNNVMHFNPEGIEPEDLEALRRFHSFLHSIVPK